MSLVTYSTYLELHPQHGALALVLDLPGCYAGGATEAAALNGLRVAVPDYFHWLSMQDTETPTMSGEVELRVAERVTTSTVGLHEVRAFFGPDAAPLADEDLDWGLALMSYAHMDLLTTVQSLHDDALTWEPGDGQRTIAQSLDHLAQQEMWLATRLDEAPQVPLVTDLAGTPLERYDKIHEQAMVRLSSAAPEWRSVIREHNGERWSMRKIIRRSILHERQHTERIAILLAQRSAGK